MVEYSKEAQRRSIRRVEKVCIDCGDDYDTSHNAVWKSKRCPRCALRYNRERYLERERDKNAYKLRAQDKPSRYELRSDPDGTWIRRPEFDMADMKAMLVACCLAEGTLVWDRKLERLFVVEKYWGGKMMHEELREIGKEADDGGVE